MTYRAPSYITDTDYGYRVKSLFILLAKTVAELNSAPSKVSDLRSIIYHLEKTKENIFDVQNEESEKLAESISHHLNANIKAAEAQIKEIDFAISKTKEEKEFILLQLNEHGVPWHDKSILLGSFRNRSPVLVSETEIDNASVATELYRDLCDEMPADSFKIKLLGETTRIGKAEEPAFSAIITFSSAYSKVLKDALKRIASKKLGEIDLDFGSANENDIANINSVFSYDVYSQSATGYMKPLFSSLIESEEPDSILSKIEFQNELVFLNLEEYYTSSDLLSEYVSMISSNNTVLDPLLSQKAESNCMEAYYEHHKGEVNIGRLTQALEREMEASRSLQQISQ